jgi:ssDNA-binding Zn-finger/Zn-ribbon topoisomerase 1
VATFLVTCPKCRAMIAKDMPCPDCHWSEAAECEGDEQPVGDVQREFARRESIHKRNYLTFMVIMLATGFVSLLTAVMWFRFIYRGSILAFFLIILLTVATAALGVTLKFAKKWFPVDLNCPACNVRLDQLGVSGTDCPACSTRLK